MRKDDSRRWELFENRPAQEHTSRRTSPDRVEEVRRNRCEAIERRQRVERVRAGRVAAGECVKC